MQDGGPASSNKRLKHGCSHLHSPCNSWVTPFPFFTVPCRLSWTSSLVARMRVYAKAPCYLVARCVSPTACMGSHSSATNHWSSCYPALWAAPILSLPSHLTSLPCRCCRNHPWPSCVASPVRFVSCLAHLLRLLRLTSLLCFLSPRVPLSCLVCYALRGSVCCCPNIVPYCNRGNSLEQ